ncbi:MAG: dihydropteroate synthase [Alphaproteobacteria bacterium]|nr:dihydropteroate synthase [Alphaproteobacteria bacterium]
MPFGNSKRPLIMGILNITPDSFSGDGLLAHQDPAAAAGAQAAQMVGEGADILDIGGESSRPSSIPVSVEEEMRRVIPVIAAIRQKFPNLPIAIDTVKAAVAQAALDAGATIINDISALGDPDMAPLAAVRKCWVVLMDNRSNPDAVTQDAKIGGEYRATDSADVTKDVIRNLSERAAAAQKAGIAKDKIILDPGLGFGKTVEQNLGLIRDIGRLKELGYSVLVGPSRKSFIGRVLDAPVEGRLEGTAALVAASTLKGADVIRVHDVQFMARVAKMAAATGPV